MIKKSSKLTLVFTLILTFLNPPLMAAPYAAEKPKLVVLIVIDQFRADYLTRFKKLFKPAYGASGEVGGFEYLTSEGAYYPFAEYDVLQSMTGPGHATTLTGAYPYQMGIPINDWYDVKTKDKMYCAEDRGFKQVGGAQADVHVGTSPKNLLATTFGDELKNAGYPSRVFSVALKDRASIMMGGHRADLALWFDAKAFQWVSSQYYLPDNKLPEWVTKINATIIAKKGTPVKWEKKGEGSGLSLTDPMMVHDAYNDAAGTEFPHVQPIGTKGSLNMPYGLEITENVAEQMIEEYKLGNGKATDVLAVSFSSHDYMGHAFGLNSREMEEMTIEDDKNISKLLNFIKKRVPGGLSNVIVALTADHGAPSNPDWLKKEKVNAGRIEEKEMVAAVEKRLETKYGKLGKDKWVTAEYDFNFYLNTDAIAKKKLSLAEVENEGKLALKEIEGVFHVVTSTDYYNRTLPPGMHERQVMKTYFEGRSGNLIVIPLPFYMSKYATVTHQTGYTYDRVVPLVLTGFHIKKGVHPEKAEIIDIAPTLSFLTGTIPPSMSEGRVLSEAIIP